MINVIKNGELTKDNSKAEGYSLDGWKVVISKQKKTHNSTVESWAIYFWFSYFHFDARFEGYDEVAFIDCNALDYLPYKLIIIF